MDKYSEEELIFLKKKFFSFLKGKDTYKKYSFRLYTKVYEFSAFIDKESKMILVSNLDSLYSLSYYCSIPKYKAPLAIEFLSPECEIKELLFINPSFTKINAGQNIDHISFQSFLNSLDERLPEFNDYFRSNKWKVDYNKHIERSQNAKLRASNRNCDLFNQKDQSKIATCIFNMLVKEHKSLFSISKGIMGNYEKELFDREGEDLMKALEIFSEPMKDKIIEHLLNGGSKEGRRFAIAKFPEHTSLGLIDEDEEVRKVAKKLLSKK